MAVDHGRGQRLHHARSVVRMNAAQPPFDGVRRICVGHAEQLEVALVAPNFVFAQVPVPDGVLGCPGDRQEPLLAFAKLLFNALAVRDVLGRGKIDLLFEAG